MKLIYHLSVLSTLEGRVLASRHYFTSDYFVLYSTRNKLIFCVRIESFTVVFKKLVSFFLLFKKLSRFVWLNPFTSSTSCLLHQHLGWYRCLLEAITYCESIQLRLSVDLLGNYCWLLLVISCVPILLPWKSFNLFFDLIVYKMTGGHLALCIVLLLRLVWLISKDL